MRQLVKALSGSALLAITTLSMPGTALAAQNHAMTSLAKWNSVSGTVRSDGTWTEEKRNGPRHKTEYGIVKLDLKNNVDGGLCVQLRSLQRDKVFTKTTTCWAPGEYDTKTVATDVRPGTAFIVDAMKRGHGHNNDWGGSIYY
jgi:hypothetical protein